MIGRFWRGWSSPELAPAYEQFLRTQVFAQLRAIDGHRGATLFRRLDDDGRVESRVVTMWRDMEAIRRFAGDQPDVAVVEPEARAVLTAFDTHVDHFDVAISD